MKPNHRLPLSVPVLALFFLTMGLLGYGNFRAVQQWTQGRQLGTQGQVTTAQVVAARATRGTRGLVENHYVEYRLPDHLDPTGKIRTAGVSSEVFDLARQHGAIQVQYLPSNPNIQRPLGSNSPLTLAYWMLALDILLLGLVTLILKGA